MIATQVNIAAKLYEARDTLRRLLGESYRNRIDETMQAVRVIAAANHCDELRAGMLILQQMQADGCGGMEQLYVLAATAELIEPSEGFWTPRRAAKRGVELMTTAKQNNGSLKTGARVAKKAKQLTRKERASVKGRFATHITALMSAANLDSHRLAAAMKIGEPTVRKWLRAESVPTDLETLQKLGDALGLDDYRMALPPA